LVQRKQVKLEFFSLFNQSYMALQSKSKDKNV